MKTLLKITGALFILLIVVMLVLPFLFKDEITGVIKNATNNNLNAIVDFDDVSLNLFSDFPNLAVGIENLSIINKAPFEGDTVISTKSIGVSVDLLSLLSGDVLRVKSVSLESPEIIVYVLADGSANYNIAKQDTTSPGEVTAADTIQSKFNIELNSYNISNGRIAFIDQTSNMIVALDNFNHFGSGDFSQDDFVLDTETSIDELTIQLDDIKYLNAVKTKLDMQLDINLPHMKFTLRDNSLSLNNLLLNFDGSVAMPGEDVDIDLKFSSPRSDFRDIISLIPAIYKNDFSDIETSGKMEFSGNINGKLTDNSFPAFNIALNVEEGNFKYPDLPTPVQNVSMDLNVNNSDGKIDNTVINLNNIKLLLGPDPIEGRLKLTKIETGPVVDTKIKGKINLANIKSAFNLNDIQKLEGLIESDFEVKGNISNASTDYKNIDAKGKIILKDLIYMEGTEDQEIKITNASLDFTPSNIRLSELTLRIDKSDLKADGTLKNLISYVISDGTLYGQLNVNSSYFDLNPFMQGEDTSGEDITQQEGKTSVFDIPSQMNFTLNSKFNRLIYDNLELQDVVGKITLKEGRISLNNLDMKLLDGSLSGSGYYAKTEYQENPDIEFNLSINDFNIKKTYDKFISVKQFAPIAKYMEGRFSSNLNMNTKLDNSMTPVWETFFSKGLLNLKTAEIKNFKPFTAVGSVLKLQELSNPKLTNVKPRFEIKNGRFYISPVEYKIGQYNVVLSGSSGIDQSIDYVMDIEIPAEKIKNQANSAISGLIGKDLNLVKSNTINVKALIGGTITSPDVKTSAADVASDITTQVKDAVVSEAKAQADSMKAAAEKKLKEEAKKKEEEMKKQLEEEAKKKLKKLFGFG